MFSFFCFENFSFALVVLLNGPPGKNQKRSQASFIIINFQKQGTGKTTICKGLAQKLSIRMSERFECGQLVEINAHSLFSKWFSESGKLVRYLIFALKIFLVFAK